MHALRQHQAQVEVVAAFERTGPAHVSRWRAGGRAAGAVVVQLEAELQAIARPHLTNKSVVPAVVPAEIADCGLDPGRSDSSSIARS